MSSKAPLHGTTCLYNYLPNSKVLVLKEGYQYRIIDKKTFEDLYFQLDDSRAALKEDCIEYTVYKSNEPLSCYPDWFIEAYDNGYIYEEEDYEDLIFYNEYGDIVMDPGSVVLRNFMGLLNYMDIYTFVKYYDVLEDEHE